MNGKTEKSGSCTHGSMDESTQKDAEDFIKAEMMGKLDDILKNPNKQSATPQKSGSN